MFFLSLCYIFHSLPYVAPLFLPWAKRACDSLSTGHSFLVQTGVNNDVCLGSFFLSYYFSLAASLWWLLFTFTWLENDFLMESLMD